MATMLPKTERQKPIKRSGSLRIRLAPAVRDRLERVSALYGVPLSTLASMAVGEYVSRAESALTMTQRMADTVGGAMGEQVRIAFESIQKAQADD
jgi:hypothetical protein